MGETVRTHFADTFRYDTFGLLTGTSNTRQFPNIPGSLARIEAISSNVDSFYIGNVKNTGSYPLPYQLQAGKDTGWFALTEQNLNSYWYSNGSGSYLAYWVQG